MSERSRSLGYRSAALSALLLLFSASFVVLAVESPSAAELYERAYFLEQGRGDLEGAIKVYRQMVSQYPENRKLAARALLRIGFCYERLGVDGATQAYRAILDKYGDQAEVARIAAEKLRLLERAREDAAAELPTGMKVRQIVLRNGKAMVGYPGSLSPDGTRIAYYNWDTENFVAQDLRNGTERSVPRPRASSSPSPATGAKWSHDGKKIAFGLGGADYVAAVVGELETGIQSIWYRRSGAYVFPIHWTRDGRLVCSMSDNDSKERSLAFLSGPGAEAVQYPIVGDGFRVAPDGKHVVYFSSKPEDNPDIFVADLARPAETTPVAPHPAGDVNPIWSADGRHLAFRSNRAGSWDLWAIAVDHGKPAAEPFRLQKDIGEQTALDTWRGDGQLVYNKSAVLQDIWLLPVNAGTGRATGKAFLLSQIQGGNYAPFWSPDGAQIGYTAARRADKKQRLYVTRIDQFKEQEIELPCDSFYNPTWSRDGKNILMIASVKNKRMFLQYEVASGEVSTFLFDHELLRKGTAFGDFSPDGRHILFDGFGPKGELAGIHIYDGSSVTKVPGTEGARPAQWSPDGHRIAFARQGNVWLVRPDGTGLRKITSLPAGEPLARLSWAPNGRFIAYTSSALFVIGVDEDFREKLPGAEGLNSGRVAWSPDGRYLALGSAQGSSELWVMENFLPKSK